MVSKQKNTELLKIFNNYSKKVLHYYSLRCILSHVVGKKYIDDKEKENETAAKNEKYPYLISVHLHIC